MSGHQLTARIEVDHADLEPKCTGAWRAGEGWPGRPEVWHARCPVCGAELTGEKPEPAIERATAHCSRKRMREELDQLHATMARLEAAK